MKQYIPNKPNKPNKRGYKVWALCDAHNGYMYNFDVYCGAAQGTAEHRLDQAVVQNTAETVLDKGHFLFFDTTSPL